VRIKPRDVFFPRARWVRAWTRIKNHEIRASPEKRDDAPVVLFQPILTRADFGFRPDTVEELVAGRSKGFMDSFASLIPLPFLKLEIAAMVAGIAASAARIMCSHVQFTSVCVGNS